MAEAIYKVGDRLVIRIQGKLGGTIEIKLVKSDAAGKRHIEAEVNRIRLDQSALRFFRLVTRLRLVSRI